MFLAPIRIIRCNVNAEREQKRREGGERGGGEWGEGGGWEFANE